MQNTEFKVNDQVMYGGSGVCTIVDIGVPGITGIDNTKQYYFLKPLYTQDSIIFSPVDSSRVIIRKLITKKETMELIAQIPDIETIWDENEKLREERYKEAIHSYNCYQWIRIIKTLFLKMEDRVHHKKAVGEKDQRYLRMTEDLLYGELAIALDIPKDKVSDFISEQVRLMEVK